MIDKQRIMTDNNILYAYICIYVEIYHNIYLYVYIVFIVYILLGLTPEKEPIGDIYAYICKIHT